MSWLGQGFDRESMKSMAEAFAEVTEMKAPGYMKGGKIGGSIKKPSGKTIKVEEVEVIEDSYSVSVEDGIALEEGKKKCKDGYEYDSDEKKCVKKKKSKTTVIIGRGYGYGHSHDDDDKDDGGDENGGNGGGGDAGGGDGGGGGGE